MEGLPSLAISSAALTAATRRCYPWRLSNVVGGPIVSGTGVPRRLAVLALLEELGHAALPASSANEALEIRREPVVDVVITDQAMPHMTGVQLADVIHDEWPDLPVILATGYAELEPGAGEGMRKLSSPSLKSNFRMNLRACRARK